MAKAENTLKEWKYRGKPVMDTSAVIKKTGDGLSKAMELDPAIYEPGSVVTFVIRARVARHQFILSEDGATYSLVQQFDAGTLAVIDDDLAAEALNDMEARIQAAEDARRKQPTLDGMDAKTGRAGRARLRAVGSEESEEADEENESE